MEENINNKENVEGFEETFEVFKEKIDTAFVEFGLDLSGIPEDLSPKEFNNWKERRRAETESVSATLAQKVIFAIELAYIHALLSEKEPEKREWHKDLVFEHVYDTRDLVKNKKGVTEQEKKELEELTEKTQKLSENLIKYNT